MLNHFGEGPTLWDTVFAVCRQSDRIWSAGACRRNAISIGRDSDKTAAIAGRMAKAKWGVPDEIKREALNPVDEALFETYQRFASRAAD